MVKVNPGSPCEKQNGSSPVPDAVYQVSRSSASCFEVEYFWRFLPYMGMVMVMWHGTFEKKSFPISHGGSIPVLIFGFNRPSGFWRKRSLKMLNWVTLDKGQWITLTLGSHKVSCTHLFDCMYQFNSLIVFPYMNKRDQIWPCCKICQCQPRLIIWIHMVVLEYQILHTQFQCHQPFGSIEEDF